MLSIDAENWKQVLIEEATMQHSKTLPYNYKMLCGSSKLLKANRVSFELNPATSANVYAVKNMAHQ